jgi:acetyl-CoA carboxylase alpha subunit
MEELTNPEQELEKTFEALAVEDEKEEAKIDTSITKEEQEQLDLASVILNKNSVSQSAHARKRRRYGPSS